MTRSINDDIRYGIGEWYGRRIDAISASDKIRYATLSGSNKEPCPYRPGEGKCNKIGGVCSLAVYRKKEDGTIVLDPENPDMVTLCPMRFWQDFVVFREAAKVVLQSNAPSLIKEIGFLKSIDHTGRTTEETVSRIDMVLADIDTRNRIRDWCALEMQAVYFSGRSMKTEFQAIKNDPEKLLFPAGIRRPDFRSSGPKRLMPQLQIKIPALRRWGKKMVVVVDNPFFKSIAPMKRARHISNADIAWFVVDYYGPGATLRVADIVLTTLESSVDGLTAGVPVSKDEFEKDLLTYLAGKRDKVIRLS